MPCKYSTSYTSKSKRALYADTLTGLQGFKRRLQEYKHTNFKFGSLFYFSLGTSTEFTNVSDLGSLMVLA